VVPYNEALAAQQAIATARREGLIPDTLLLLEHPPVYTKGRRHDPSELPMGEDWYRMQGIEVCETDRGGRVTYHGPGQLVGYPIVDLRERGDDVHAFVRDLERVMLESLSAHDVPCQVVDGLTGVWTLGALPIEAGELGPQGTEVGPTTGTGEARKIGAIGVHVSKGITTHGFAINVANDLQPFEWIVPCGIEAARATSLTRELGVEQDLGELAATVRDTFGRVFGTGTEERTPHELAAAVPAAAALTEAPVGLVG
jgi:lipoyl(octanoyl) transferase